MKACRTASALGAAALFGVGAIGACHQRRRAEVPPLTVAAPGAATATASGSATASATAPASAYAPAAVPVEVAFVDLPAKLLDGLCSRVFVALVKGRAVAMKETLAPGDVLVVTHGEAAPIEGTGLAVLALQRVVPCPVRARPAPEKTVVRASAAPELTWAGGAMRAHLDVGTNVSPEVYLGRLEGTAAVAEHTHPGAWEIIAAVEAAGAFTVGGVERRLASRQIVVVPPDTKHAWRPDPGSTLVAIQMYDPPGPERRFVELAAAAKDAGAK